MTFWQFHKIQNFPFKFYWQNLDRNSITHLTINLQLLLNISGKHNSSKGYPKGCGNRNIFSSWICDCCDKFQPVEYHTVWRLFYWCQLHNRFCCCWKSICKEIKTYILYPRYVNTEFLNYGISYFTINAWIMSYSKCWNCCRILKFSLNFESLFSFNF